VERQEMETSEPVRSWQRSGRLLIEQGHKFRIYGCRIVALGLPVRNKTICVDHQNNVFLDMHDDRFLFSGKMTILNVKCLMNELHLKIGA
jgi:hypothetical protein